jgi:hypothetical protein
MMSFEIIGNHTQLMFTNSFLKTGNRRNLVGAAPSSVTKSEFFIVFIDPEFGVDWIANGEMSAEAKKAVSFVESTTKDAHDFAAKLLPAQHTPEYAPLWLAYPFAVKA